MAFLKEHETWRDAPPAPKKEKISLGGQALIEGIMMKGPKGTAVSVRLPDGSIETEMKDFTSIRKKYKLFNVPIVRGIVSFVESMIQGYSLMADSAEKSMSDEEKEAEQAKQSKLISAISVIASILGFALSFFLFIWAPSFLFDLTKNLSMAETIAPWRAIIEGAFRIIIFIAYMFLVSKNKDIKRVYMYHGAEHKTIFCYEHGHELTIENIKKESRLHPRCGTSFVFVTIILSIIASSIASIIFPALTASRAIWVLFKLILIPLILGIGFEVIQFSGKCSNKFTKVLSAPGLLMQKITTAEPTDDMIEVAIAAVSAVLTGEIDEHHWTVQHSNFVKSGAEKLCEENPDIVEDIINS